MLLLRFYCVHDVVYGVGLVCFVFSFWLGCVCGVLICVVVGGWGFYVVWMRGFVCCWLVFRWGVGVGCGRYYLCWVGWLCWYVV